VSASSRRIAVFAYGSLVRSQSAAELLGRPIVGAQPARLVGWQRRWSLKRHNLTCEKTFARSQDGSTPKWVLALNIEPVRVQGPAITEGRPGATEPDERPNGLLIPITDQELARFDQREMRYARVDVSGQVHVSARGGGAETGPDFARVVAYSAQPDHYAARPPDDAVILRSYVLAVERAFARLGASELSDYRLSTEAPPVEVVDGTLVADSIPAGNPRDW